MKPQSQLTNSQKFASQKALTESWARLASRFQELHRLGLTAYASHVEQYGDYLKTGLALLDMEIGIVSRIRDGLYTILAVEPAVDLYPGQRFELGDTYCAWVVEKAGAIALNHIGDDPEKSQHPVYREQALEAYVAAPIWVNGEIFGTLNFSHTKARSEPFDEADWELVELMARGLGQAIERNQLEERREAATQLMRENVDLFESAFSYASNGIALVAPDGRWLRVNDAVSKIVGYTSEELLSIDFQTITHPEDLQKDLEHVREMLQGERDTYRMEKRYYHKNGHIVWVLLSVSLVRHEDGAPRYFISQLQDISEQKRVVEELQQNRSQLEMANRRLQQLATRDPLTHVLNRRAFDDRISEELQRAARSALPLSLILLDIDYFKRFNDDFGHPAGDEALRQVAKALVTAGRIDDIVARYGGEEFAIILPNTDAAGCRIAAERLRSAISGIGGLERGLTASLGTATIDRHNDIGHSGDRACDALIHCADEALYRAKAAGRDQCQHATMSGPMRVVK